MITGPKRICLLSVEIFAWGKYGGYGKATRMIGRELVKRGYEVFAVIPQRHGQQKEENLDGITVLGYTPAEILNVGQICKRINADIYHSCEPSIATWLAMKAVPSAKHMVTCRDPKGFDEWIQEFRHPSKSKWQVVQNYLFEANGLVRRAVRSANHVFVAAKFQQVKTRNLYQLKVLPDFLPTPTEFIHVGSKADIPTVLYMGRLDHRKRPEATLNLAKCFPQVQFRIAGKSRNPEYENHLKETYSIYPNIEFLGFVKQFEGDTHHRLLTEAWIHINTAIREGLPNSFIEAAGHSCAILSYVNPDAFSSTFGYHAGKDDFEKGLSWLLEDQHWKEMGRAGFEYVSSTYEMSKAMDAHEQVYAKAWSVQ